jgi:hypothetical protein
LFLGKLQAAGDRLRLQIGCVYDELEVDMGEDRGVLLTSRASGLDLQAAWRHVGPAKKQSEGPSRA